MTPRKVKVSVHVALSIVLALVCLSTVGLAEPQSQSAGGKTYINPGFDLRKQVMVNDQTLYVYERGISNEPYMIITDEYGNIIKDPSLYEPAGYGSMLYRRQSDLQAIRFNREMQKSIEDFLWWETAASVALFSRDIAARALVDVGLIYMTGDTSQLSKGVVKKVARSALSSTVEDMIKNPDNYLRAMVLKLCKDTLQELKAIESAAVSMEGKEKISYDELEALETRSQETYSKIVPAMGLMQALRPEADIISQIEDVWGIMEDRLWDQIPSAYEPLTEARTNTIYESLGNTLNEIYQDCVPYWTYQQEKAEFEALLAEDYSHELALVREKLNNGLELTRDYTKFSKSPMPLAEAERMVTQHLGTITHQQAPKTWTISVPEGSEKVEVAIYGYGKEDEGNMYGGWAAYLKVNGKYAWEFIRHDKELGGVIYDHLKGEEVLEVNGKDSYYDITSMVTAGENTITYYHFTGGSGIGVKVRIHEKA